MTVQEFIKQLSQFNQTAEVRLYHTDDVRMIQVDEHGEAILYIGDALEIDDIEDEYAEGS